MNIVLVDVVESETGNHTMIVLQNVIWIAENKDIGRTTIEMLNGRRMETDEPFSHLWSRIVDHQRNSHE